MWEPQVVPQMVLKQPPYHSIIFRQMWRCTAGSQSAHTVTVKVDRLWGTCYPNQDAEISHLLPKSSQVTL